MDSETVGEAPAEARVDRGIAAGAHAILLVEEARAEKGAALQSNCGLFGVWSSSVPAPERRYRSARRPQSSKDVSSDASLPVFTRIRVTYAKRK